MPDAAIATRAELEACTDEALAWLRDPANRVPGAAGEFYDSVAASVAGELLREFPSSFPLGRIVMAVAQGLSSAQGGIEEHAGGPVPAEVLLNVAFYAAEKLDRQEAEATAVTADDPVDALWPQDPARQTLIGTRALNSLRRDGISTVGELTSRSAADIRDIRRAGRKIVAEIRRALAVHGLALKDDDEEAAVHG